MIWLLNRRAPSLQNGILSAQSGNTLYHMLMHCSDCKLWRLMTCWNGKQICFFLITAVFGEVKKNLWRHDPLGRKYKERVPFFILLGVNILVYRIKSKHEACVKAEEIQKSFWFCCLFACLFLACASTLKPFWFCWQWPLTALYFSLPKSRLYSPITHWLPLTVNLPMQH